MPGHQRSQPYKGRLSWGFTCNPERELKRRKCPQLDANLNPRQHWVSRFSWANSVVKPSFSKNPPHAVGWMDVKIPPEDGWFGYDRRVVSSVAWLNGAVPVRCRVGLRSVRTLDPQPE